MRPNFSEEVVLALFQHALSPSPVILQGCGCQGLSKTVGESTLCFAYTKDICFVVGITGSAKLTLLMLLQVVLKQISESNLVALNAPVKPNNFRFNFDMDWSYFSRMILYVFVLKDASCYEKKLYFRIMIALASDFCIGRLILYRRIRFMIIEAKP